MANNISNVSMTQPNDYSIELADIERRKKLAELLQVKGQEPSGGTEMVGGWAIPKSPWEGIGKASQQMSGAYQQNQLTERQKAISNEQQQRSSTEGAKFAELLNGRSAQPEQARQGPLNDDEGNPMPGVAAQPAVAADPRAALAYAIQSQDPTLKAVGQSATATQLASMLKPSEGAFGKVDPAHYTADSVRAFQAGGGKDFAALVPRVSPDTQAKLDQAKQQWEGLSQHQQLSLAMEAAKLNISVQDLLIKRSTAANHASQTAFETGGGVAPPQVVPPQIPQVPPAGAPQAAPVGASPMPAQVPPQSAPRSQGGVFGTNSPPAVQSGSMFRPPASPQANDGLTPAARVQVAKERAVSQNAMETKREFNMGGLNETIAEARKILTGGGGALPTSSGVGSIVDSVGSFVGMAPKGAAQADQLRALGGALTSKVPRMEGPQSDKDVQLYREMAGQVGDSGLPIGRRLAALDEVQRLYGKYENLNRGVGVQGAPPLTGVTDRRANPRSGARVVVDY